MLFGASGVTRNLKVGHRQARHWEWGAGWLFAAHVSDDMILNCDRCSRARFRRQCLVVTEHMSHPSTIIGGVFWGSIAGFASFASKGGGPPYQVHMLPERLPKMVFVGTTTIFFAAVKLTKGCAGFYVGRLELKFFLSSSAAAARSTGERCRHQDGATRPDRGLFTVSPTSCCSTGLLLLWQGLKS